MKHDDDCTCRDCKRRTSAPPSSRITIPVADIAGTIAESLMHELEAHSVTLVKMQGIHGGRVLDGRESADLIAEFANNVVMGLQGLDETPDEPKAPAFAITPARRSQADIDARRPRIRGRR